MCGCNRIRRMGSSLALFGSRTGGAAIRGQAEQPAAIPARPLADAASSEPALKYLPKDYWLIARLDVKTCMEFLDNDQAKNNPQYAQLRQALQTITLLSGIDPEKDIDSVTAFAAGDPDASLRGLIAVRGRFDGPAVSTRLRNAVPNGLAESDYKGKTIYSGSAGGFCIPDNSTLLAGDVKLLQGAIDNLDSKEPAMSAGLKNVLDRTNGRSLVWVAAKPQTVLGTKLLADWRAANADLCSALGKIDCVSLAFDMSDDGLLVKALGFVPANGEGKGVYQYLSQRKDNLLHRDGSNVFSASFLILSQLANDGPYVQGSLRITGEALKELWETKVVVKP